VLEKGNIEASIAGICTSICKHGMAATFMPKDNGYILLNFAKQYFILKTKIEI
jgi:hypothetical protein